MTDPEDPGPDPSAAPVVLDEQDVPADAALLADAAARALDALGIASEAMLSITLAGPGRMAELKEQAFGARVPTDVLAFPIDDPADPMPGPVVLGDVVICPAVALRQARALGRTLDDEMTRLLVHGILHVLGRDHDDVRAERAMAREERAVLARMHARAAGAAG
jgi:probable rRNA maturation factor